ncbi:MAG: bifunctional 4-hydroxy-2-oxoglutarate aldolase/2-dehydro-3-deoxy-phosphogluconate aldolase [Sphingomicrobium sp.]
MTIGTIMQTAPVIPVLVLDGSIDPVALAETLVEAGLRVLEVTLRTPQALDAIRAMAGVEGAIVGAGTVLNAGMLEASIAAGSQFIVSPGLTEPLGRAAIESGVPFLPGVANAGDIMRGLDLGLDRFKFFPAEAAGGLKALASLAGPFGDVRFCPTGGITVESAPSWLAHPAVRCVGGSWIVKAGETDLAAIAQRARAAASLKG